MELTFFISLFHLSPSFAKPCGLQGSIEEQIKDCDVEKNLFVLLSQDDKRVEIHQGTKSGLSCGSRHFVDYNHYGSQNACSDSNPHTEIKEDLKGRLPTIKEFEESANHGMKAGLPSMNSWFRTSTPVQKGKSKRGRRKDENPTQVYLWDVFDEFLDIGDLKDGASVRCVAK